MNSKIVTTLIISCILCGFLIRSSQAAIQVYEDIYFKGATRLLPPFKACLDLSNVWQDRISSVNTTGGCIILCVEKRCKGRCEKMFPGTNAHHDLRLLDLNDKISSYQNCENPNDNNVPV